MTTNIIVSSSAAIIGNVSPYSYQVQPKKTSTAQQVSFNGDLFPSRLTKGQGKGSATRYYAYFMVETFQHWVELTEATYTEMSKNPAFVLELTPETVAAPVAPAPVAAEKPARKAKKATREAVAA